MEGEKIIMDFKTIVSQYTFGYGIRRSSSLRLKSLLLSYMSVESLVVIFLENYGERENPKDFCNL